MNYNLTENLIDITNPEIKSDVALKKEFYVPRNTTYGKSAVHPLWSRNNNSSSTGKKYTNEQIRTMLLDPYNNYKSLQQVSDYFWHNSPFYQNIIYYFGTLMTFDGVLSPDALSNEKLITIENRLLNSAWMLKRLNIRENFPSMVIRALLNGETYWYDLSSESGSGTAIVEEIPSKYCQLAYIDDSTGMWRYYVNLSLIDNGALFELPKEIKDAYENYIKMDKATRKAKTPHPELGIDIPNYLHLVGDRGFSIFVHKVKGKHDYPFLASMFLDINTLEDNKDYIDEFLKESNIKLLHLKIPTHPETGEPLMDEPFIRAFHESAKEHLPKSTAPLTNPFDAEALNFDIKDSTLSVVNNSKDMAQFSSGISSTLFDADTTNGLGYSIEIDASKMYPLLSFFTDFINFKIKSQKFHVSLLHIHQHNRELWHKQYATDLLNGGHRSLFMVTNGMDLYDSIMIAKMEIMLDFDSLLPCKMNASQLSAGDLESENGRPKVEPKKASDSSNKAQDYK